MKTISLSAYNRPHALSRMLESLKRNNTDGWRIFVSMDHSLACLDLITEIDWIGVNVSCAQSRLGLSLNTFLAPSLAFSSGSDFNLYLEDDLILSPDALDLCNWYERESSDDPGVGMVLWRNNIATKDQCSLVDGLGQGGHGNGFVCTKNQWESFWRKEWFGYGSEGPGRQWDLHTDVRLRELGLHVMSPIYPRSVQQKIDGTHGKSSDENPLMNVPIYDGPPVKEFYAI